MASSSRVSSSNKSIVACVTKLAQTELKRLADPQKAIKMQGYCKTTMPMYGIQKPDRARVEKMIYETLQERDVTITLSLYRDCIQAFWKLPRREEKYLAIDFALKYKDHIVWENLPLYEHFLIRKNDEGIMWWDFLDPIAINLIGRVALDNKTQMEPILRRWIVDDDNMWIRRTAILAQLKHKEETDADLLFDLCRERMHEKEVFIRKAIGWALREYGKTNPDGVIRFLKENKSSLSGLSYREGARILIKQGLM